MEDTLTLDELRGLWHVSRSALYKWRPMFPVDPSPKDKGGSVRYSVDQINAWHQAHKNNDAAFPSVEALLAYEAATGQPSLHTAASAAKALGVSTSQVNMLANKGELFAVRVGREWRILATSVAEQLAKAALHPQRLRRKRRPNTQQRIRRSSPAPQELEVLSAQNIGQLTGLPVEDVEKLIYRFCLRNNCSKQAGACPTLQCLQSYMTVNLSGDVTATTWIESARSTRPVLATAMGLSEDQLKSALRRGDFRTLTLPNGAVAIMGADAHYYGQDLAEKLRS